MDSRFHGNDELRAFIEFINRSQIMNNNNHKSITGFSLIELLIALTIFTIGLLALVKAQLLAIQHTRYAYQLSVQAWHDYGKQQLADATHSSHE